MLPVRLRVLYLHGFASGPESRKARFFSEHLRDLGFPVTVPDLAEGDFERLTIRAQLSLIERVSDRQRVVLIGSSLGGYLAALYAARHPEVDRLILLAPAFDFYHLWMSQLGEQRVAEWRQSGTVNVFHYAAGREMPLAYGFLEDARNFEPFPDFQQPALIFHGNRDTSVPVSSSEKLAEDGANVRLMRLDSDHELTDVLVPIWQAAREFLLAPIPLSE